ncbi:efflux RND transporter periplasmic adaptor subunit [Fictibacillus sp. Mic-4]|uniref:HlyD family secretion protein n=1 Tax=Fictibacillus TaxID=1329200 RepID=UPI0004140C3E|nr:efflux RND transporter periplasmic adaptor subunit [Fictibacillus gelatini]
MNARRMILLNVILLLILVGGGFAAYYYYTNSVNYLKTDNAQITGQQVTIAATANGQLTDWKGDVGEKFKKGDEIGTIHPAGAAVPGAPAPKTIKIKAPADGTVVQKSAVKDSFVAAGTPLAQMYDLENLWVTANIEETSINDVKKGQDVDVYVDAYPGSTLTGTVDQIGYATAGTFSLMPSSNTSGNYTKVTQVIPVKIKLDNYKGLDIVPGMNVTVRIHK